VDIQGQLFEEMGDETRSAAVPRIGLVVAANLQHLTGVPWAATTQISLSAGVAASVARAARIAAAVVSPNALHDKAEEGLVDDNLFSSNFALSGVFIDPRRAMLAVRFTFQR